MLVKENIPQTSIEEVKRYLNITWSDTDTDARVIDQMMDSEIAMNYKLGAEIDYFVPGLERQLYLNHILYAWNKCANEFDSAYGAELMQVRRKYEVEGARSETVQE